MNTQKYINVYSAISAQKMYAYGKWIAKICFGVKPDTNKHYSFVSNPINGHFSFVVSTKYYQPSTTPQTENEAKMLLNKLISGLVSKLESSSKEPDFPKDFPILFNGSHLKLKGISPNYNATGNFIISWSALYGIELQTFSPKSSDDFQNAKGALENDSIIVEICGNNIVTLHHNYTPVIQKKSVAIAPDDNSEFIYKKVNQTTIAPYYLTANGYVPACNDSVPILTQPVSYGWNTIEKTAPDSKKSMLTLSDIVPPDPEKGIPGSAKIVIAMDYRVITMGEGMVYNTEILINTGEFSDLYKKGNIPEKIYKKPLKVKELPSLDKEAELLTEVELMQSEKVDETTQNLTFWKYYNVTIEYLFNLDKKSNFSLWQGINWVKEHPDSRGLIYLVPFEEEVLAWSNSDNITNSRKEQKIYNNEQLQDILQIKKQNVKNIARAKFIAFTLNHIILDNVKKYEKANLYVTKSILYSNVIQDITLKSTLSSITSNFHQDKGEDVSKPWVEIEEFNIMYFKYIMDIEYLAWREIKDFKELENGIKAAGAAMNMTLNLPLNFVMLNHDFFGEISFYKDFNFGGMTSTEVLVHEAGHNSAKDFYHKGVTDGNYEYRQTGLQSNSHGNIYPTKENTLSIINDLDNRKNMTIL